MDTVLFGVKGVSLEEISYSKKISFLKGDITGYTEGLTSIYILMRTLGFSARLLQFAILSHLILTLFIIP